MNARRPSVLTALPDVWDGAVVGRLGSRVLVGRRCVDLPDLLAAAHARLGDVALVSPRLRGLDLSAIRDLRLCSVGVLGVVDPGDEAGEALLRQLGIRAFVGPDAPAPDLYGAVVGALAVPSSTEGSDETEEATPDEVAPRGRVVVVWGPAGAPGRTTVAVNLAAELALDGREVVLVDVDTQAASVAQHLAILDEAPGIASACRAAEHGTLDVTSFARLAPEVLPRLRVLTGLPSADRWPELRAGAVERVLDVARLDCDVVVVDCASCLEDDDELSYDTVAPRRNMAALTALEVADQVVVVGAGDPVGLQRLVRGLQELAGREVEAGVVVVNRLRASAVGPRPTARIQSLLERFGGVEDPVLVPLDVERVDAALLAGTVLHDVAPDSAVRSAIASVAAAVVR
ncbi:AAA family ATPase [Arsenicicoccus cauae]|uniref:AAA family ATPase n=1 Tax=Arsenicicoccus cauae TaxID=2663847 RepID=UPI00289A1A04|nr:AAA family ATPase [Arsenicicoccus cauae]